MNITLNKIDSFVENLAEKFIDLGGAGLTLALTNTAHTASWDELADLTQISYTNLSSRAVTVTSSSQTGGLYKLILQQVVLTASGVVPTWEFIYLYDDASTGKKLIGYADWGSAVNMNTGDSVTLTFDAVNGAISIQ